MIETPPDADPYQRARERLIAAIARTTGIEDRRILGAFSRVPRHAFVPEAERAAAYQDRALPIGKGQTISQPSMIAIMLAELAPQPNERALEVGSGSGYAAALLGQLVSAVDGIELVPELAERAGRLLVELGYENVRVHCGDGSLGLPERGPFDVILVSAAARSIPEALIAQLAPGGRIAIPVGTELDQTLLVGERAPDGGLSVRTSTSCVFVPLLTPNQPSAS